MDQDFDSLLLGFNDSDSVQKDPIVPNGLDGSVVEPTIADPTAITARKRRPQVKLTAEKLLSDKGLPYVLKNAHKRIRISSKKTHMTTYQILFSFTSFGHMNCFPRQNLRIL